MRNSWAILVAAVVVVGAGAALAGVLRPLAGPPTPEEQVMAIAADLRCPVCAGESAAAADTTQAQAMRAQIASDLQAGMSRQAILGQFAAQYGTWILDRPPERGAFLLLWIAPVLAAAGVGAGIFRLVLPRGGAGRDQAERSAAAEGTAAGVGSEPGPATAVSAALRARLSRFL